MTHPVHPRRRAVIYVRTASSAAQDRHHVERQRLRCRHVANQLGFTVTATFADPGVSGLSLERAGVRALFQHLDEHGADAVICWDPARLARDLTLSAALTMRIAETGAWLIYASKQAHGLPELALPGEAA